MVKKAKKRATQKKRPVNKKNRKKWNAPEFVSELKKKLTVLDKQQGCSTGRVWAKEDETATEPSSSSKSFDQSLDSESIPNSLNILAMLHNQITALEVRFQQETYEMEQLYLHNYYSPLLELRQSLLGLQHRDRKCPFVKKELSGLVEKALPCFMFKSEETARLKTNLLRYVGYDGVRKFNDFWLEVLQRSSLFVSNLIQLEDIEPLKSLTNITSDLFFVEDQSFIHGGKNTVARLELKFHFAPNKYFSNPVLQKQYLVNAFPDAEDYLLINGPEGVECNEKLLCYKGPLLIAVKGCKIKWTPESTTCDSNSSPSVLRSLNGSFFDFFERSWDRRSQECSEEIQKDYKVGSCIRDVIIPQAFAIYCSSSKAHSSSTDLSSTPNLIPICQMDNDLRSPESSTTYNNDVPDPNIINQVLQNICEDVTSVQSLTNPTQENSCFERSVCDVDSTIRQYSGYSSESAACQLDSRESVNYCHEDFGKDYIEKKDSEISNKQSNESIRLGVRTCELAQDEDVATPEITRQSTFSTEMLPYKTNYFERNYDDVDDAVEIMPDYDEVDDCVMIPPPPKILFATRSEIIPGQPLNESDMSDGLYSGIGCYGEDEEDWSDTTAPVPGTKANDLFFTFKTESQLMEKATPAEDEPFGFRNVSPYPDETRGLCDVSDLESSRATSTPISEGFYNVTTPSSSSSEGDILEATNRDEIVPLLSMGSPTNKNGETPAGPPFSFNSPNVPKEDVVKFPADYDSEAPLPDADDVNLCKQQ